VCDEQGLAVFGLLPRGGRIKHEAHLLAFDSSSSMAAISGASRLRRARPSSLPRRRRGLAFDASTPDRPPRTPSGSAAGDRGRHTDARHRVPGQKDNTEGTSEDAARSRMRATAEHDGPTSARYVSESPRDRWSCGARFCSRFRRVDVFGFLAERKCPIHFREFPVPATVAQ
jgi:hypothetical protein